MTTELYLVGLWQLAQRAGHDDPYAAAIVSELRRLYTLTGERIPLAIAEITRQPGEYTEQGEFWFGVMLDPEPTTTDPGE